MADWTANSDFGSLAATREPVLRSPREAAPVGLRAEPRVAREEAPRLSPGVAALAQYNAAHGGPLAKARLAVWAGGGVLSLALMAGLGVWGYKLVLREVMGLPVVEAEDGPMRVLPADPQGEVVPSQGLAVNAIPAAGTAAPPSDVLILAPQAPGLAEEDLEVVQTRAEAGEVMPASVVSAVATDPLGLVEAGTEPPTVPAPEPLIMASLDSAVPPPALHAAGAPASTEGAPTLEAEAARLVAALLPPDRAMTAEEILALADQVAAGSQTLAPATTLAQASTAAALTPTAPTALPPIAPVETTLAAAIVPPAPVAAAAPTPAASFSVRPTLRPSTLGAPAAAPAAPTAAAAIPASTEAAPASAVATTPSLPAGTNLVQLGAFDSAEIAAAEWDRLQSRFGEFLGSKERVIQEAQSQGRTFFRLRALGFADRADARRLCAALTAESAACIPVTVD